MRIVYLEITLIALIFQTKPTAEIIKHILTRSVWKTTFKIVVTEKIASMSI